MKKVSLIAFVMIVIIITMVSFFYWGREDKNSINLQTVKVAQFADVFIYAPLYIANAKGFYQDEGIKVEFINTGGDDKTYAAVIGGSATFGVADPAFVAIAKENGINGRVIGGIVNGVPFWAITTNKNIPTITEPQMLAPYSVATFAAPSTAYTVQTEMYNKGGIRPNIKQGNFGGIIPMMETGNADIALELEPNVSSAVYAGAKIVYSLAEQYPDFAFTGITTTQKTIDENPKLVQHFINAITKAEKYTHEYPDSAAIYMCKLYPNINPIIVKDAIRRLVATNTLPDNAIIKIEAWKKSLEMRKQMGDLKSLEKTEEILDMHFANKAKDIRWK